MKDLLKKASGKKPGHQFKPAEVFLRRGATMNEKAFRADGLIYSTLVRLQAPASDLRILEYHDSSPERCIVEASVESIDDEKLRRVWNLPHTAVGRRSLRKLAEDADRQADTVVNLRFHKNDWCDILNVCRVLGIEVEQWILGNIRWQAERKRRQLRELAGDFLTPEQGDSPFGRFEAALKGGEA